MALVRLIVNPNEESESSFEIQATCVTVGTAGDNDICLDSPSVSAHHFKIERRQERWFLVDLHSKQGTFLRDQKVDETGIERGTIFVAGEVHILFDVVESADEEAVPADMLPALSRGQTGLVAANMLPCWRCKQPVPQGTAFCPSCGADQRGAYVPSPFVQPVESPLAPGAGLMPLVAFMMSVLGITCILGIILGFLSISIIRRRGGHPSDVRRAHMAVYIGFVWLVMFCGLGSWWFYGTSTDRRVRRNETLAMEQLRDVAVAQTFCKLTLAVDADRDGIGEYGGFDVLVSNQYGNVAKALAETSTWHGFSFTMLRADEGGFVCAARPQNLARTNGRLSFLIDAEGFVHGDELKETDTLTAGSELKRIDRSSAVEDRADEIVQEVCKVAEVALRNKRYEQALEMVTQARKRFPTCKEVANLDMVDKRTMPFVVEIRALELLSQASNAFVQGQFLREIEILMSLRTNYPTFSGIERVDKRLREQKDKVMQEAEVLAQAQLDKAIACEVRLEFDAAEKGYRTVANQFGSTAAGVEAERRIALLAQRKSDQSASTTLQEAFSLDLDKQYQDILSRVEQLRRVYGDSLVVSQAVERLDLLEKKATARIFAAEGRTAMKSNDFIRALASFERAADNDVAYIPAFASNYSRALLYGVSNSLAASDTRAALTYAERFQELRVGIQDLPVEQVDRIRLAMAQLCLGRGDHSNAMAQIKAIGERLDTNPKMGFTAGKIYYGIGEFGRAAECFERCMAEKDYAREAKVMMIASAANAGAMAESNVCAIIARDPEWSTLTRQFGYAIPGVTNSAGTSTWQNLCIDLADQLDMSSELLTSSDELFVEKQEARNELNGAMRKLQKMLDVSIRNHKEATLAMQDAAKWWGVSLGLATNYPAASLTDETREWMTTFTRKQKIAKTAAEWLALAANADYKVKNDIRDYLKDLVIKLDQKMPIKNVLSTMKKFYTDQKPTELGRKAMNAVAEQCVIAADVTKVSDDFSRL